MLKYIIIFIFCTAITNAMEANIKSKLINNAFSIGNKVEVLYEVQYDANKYNLVQPVVVGIYGGLEVLEFKNTKTTIENGSTTYKTYILQLICFEAGAYVLPGMAFVFEDIGSERIISKISESYAIAINDIILPSDAALQEIAPVYLSEKMWSYRNIIIASALLLVILSIVVVLRNFMNKRS